MEGEADYDAIIEHGVARTANVTLTEGQRRAFDAITIRSHSSNPYSRHEYLPPFFLHSTAGTGKTCHDNAVCNEIHGNGGVVLYASCSRIASLFSPVDEWRVII